MRLNMGIVTAVSSTVVLIAAMTLPVNSQAQEFDPCVYCLGEAKELADACFDAGLEPSYCEGLYDGFVEEVCDVEGVCLE